MSKPFEAQDKLKLRPPGSGYATRAGRPFEAQGNETPFEGTQDKPALPSQEQELPSHR